MPLCGQRSPAAALHNLPLQLTSFVGREREMAAVRALLERQRLVTLTGAGGTGKTRLALQATAGLLPAYPDGVWLAELAALVDPALVPRAVAQAVGVREEPGRPLLATLPDALRAKRLLLVLDNCEHLLDACARLADVLLRACPRFTILATSREALGIAGETAWRVPSLALPDAAQPPLAEALTQSAAVRLFIERAAAVQPAFALTDHNAPAVAQLCARLDGIPLALELAAARVRVLPPEQLLSRLDDRFRLLTGGSRTALARHQTLRAAVDWSYDLLTEPERTLFARLSIFAGGFTLEAAEAVGAGPGGPGGPEGLGGAGIGAPEVLDLLIHLVNSSLVEAEAQPGGTARYRLLETLRQYARQRLDAGGAAPAAHARHAAVYLALAEAAAPALHGPRQRRWLDRLEAEHDNLRAALRWLLDREDPDGAVRLGWALRWFWEIRGHAAEGRRWLAGVLAHPGLPARPALHARALAAAGKLALARQDYGAARPLLAAGLDLYRGLGDPAGAAAAARDLGVATFRAGDPGGGLAALAASLATFRALGDRWETAETLNMLATLTRNRGDHAAALPTYEESLALYRQVGDRRGEGSALQALGNMALTQGDYDQARSWSTQSLALMGGLGHRLGTAISLINLALGALCQARYEPARGHGEALLALGRDHGFPLATAWGRGVLGAIALAENDRERARAGFGGALALSAHGALPGVLEQSAVEWALGGAAALAAVERQAARAVRLAAAATAQRRPVHSGGAGVVSRSLHRLFDPRLAPARRQLSEPARAAAETEGRAMTLEQAVAYALDEALDSRPPAPVRSGPVDPAPGGLTPREQEVAVRVARGDTNAQIARALVIAPRTAMRHVEHVMAKLGVHSRAQIAAWAAHQGLLGGSDQ